MKKEKYEELKALVTTNKNQSVKIKCYNTNTNKNEWVQFKINGFVNEERISEDSKNYSYDCSVLLESPTGVKITRKLWTVATEFLPKKKKIRR